MRNTRTTSRSAGRRALLATTAALLSMGTVATTASATSVPEGDPDAAVVAGFVAEPPNLDILHQAGASLDQLLLGNIYETLVTSTPDGEISPGLAELEISEDRLTYTLILQEGVTFHDGDPLTASDVVWSLDQLRGEGGFEAPRLASVEAVEAPDDTTVVVTLSAPDNDLAFHLSQRAGAVLNEGATDVENSANGTGPFVLDEWNQGSSITLVRNDDYWGEPASIAEITFQYFLDPDAAANALLDGDIDLHTRIDTDLVEQFEGKTRLRDVDGPDQRRVHPRHEQRRRGAVRPACPPGDHPGDRQAGSDRPLPRLRHADRRPGVAVRTVVRGPFRPLPLDPEAARALLEEAGHADGLELTFVAPNLYPTYAFDYVVCRNSTMSASPSTSRSSSSRRGSTGCLATTTTT